MIDLAHLTSDPAMKAAIEAQREAERLVMVDPTCAQGDPSAFVAIFCVCAFVQADGDCATIREIIDRASISAPVGRA